MSMSEECDVNDKTNNSRSSRNLPSHGSLPKWLEDMSETVSTNNQPTAESRQNRFYHFVDLNALKNGSHIPSQFSGFDGQTIEKRNTRPSSHSKQARFGRRSSLAAQIYARHTPRHIMLTNSDYLVPQLEGHIDFNALHKDIKQADLERSWKSLNSFQQTHKGRLDSAKTEIPKVSENWRDVVSPLVTQSEINTSSSYSPSFLEKHAPNVRSKSEMSNYDPSFVYSYFKRATRADYNDTPNSLHSDTTDLLNNLSISKAKSSEDIYNYFAPNFKQSYSNKLNSSFSSTKSDKPMRVRLLEDNMHDMYLDRSHIERHLSEYKLKVEQENRLRERIINELLSENERITERLRNRNTKYKTNKGKMLSNSSFEDVPLHQKLYSKNSKYKSTTFLTQYNNQESETSDSGYEKENLIEYYVEGGDSPSFFVIPELPTGKILRIDILSTWGDKHYVGLNGIEIFGDDGKIVDVRKISALPSDVNVLPENHNDPRVVKNLLDGVNRTQDDVHLWLAPFDEGSEHSIMIEFRNVTTIAMIRIWNYNKSRIHSFRGVKDVIMTLDGSAVFKGEIAKACGGILGGVDAFGDTILFTTDDHILELISQNDNSYSTLTTTTKPESPITIERPPTVATMASRPYTGAPQETTSTDSYIAKDQILLGASRVDIVLVSNWGYANIIGLTGLEIIGISDNVIPLKDENLSCNSNIRTVNLKALINGDNITTEIGNMWWLPYRSSQESVITIQFNEFVYISGLRIWNYNQSPETTYAGVRTIRVLLDGKPLMNHLRKDDTFLLRRAPGNTHYDFVQDVKFGETSITPANENYMQVTSGLNPLSLYRSEMPEGFVFQFIIFSTWGDQYYCGLNGIELYDEFGKKILLEEQNACAYPESINVLPGVNGDIRTPDKLIDGISSDDEGAHSWLAPIIPKCLNKIYIVLDQPVTVSLIKLWNYSKTPTRGVKEFGVLVDDLLVYNGILDKYVKRKGLPTHRSILFTDDKDIMQKEINTHIRHSSYGQEVILLDENRMTTGGSLPNPDQALRPFTSVSPFDKGYVSQ